MTWPATLAAAVDFLIVITPGGDGTRGLIEISTRVDGPDAVIAIASAEGPWLVDVEGKRYLVEDVLAGKLSMMPLATWAVLVTSMATVSTA